MARSRNIKPGFFKNETLAECSPLARLLFAGLWCVADRAGRLEDRPKRIRAEVLPYDDGSVDDMLNDLHRAGFITRYQINEQHFIQVRNFSRHQNPHHREAESTIPAPEMSELRPSNASNTPRASLGLSPDKPETSRADSLNLIPDSLNLIPAKPTCSPSASGAVNDGFATFWNAYPKKVGKGAAEKAWKKLKPDLPTVLKAIERTRATEQWRKDNGQFIPHPVTWLNQRRWEDDEPETSIGVGGAYSGPPTPGDKRMRHGVEEVFTDGAGWVPA